MVSIIEITIAVSVSSGSVDRKAFAPLMCTHTYDTQIPMKCLHTLQITAQQHMLPTKMFSGVIYTRGKKTTHDESARREQNDLVTLSHTRLIIFDVSHLLDDAPSNPTVSTPNRFKRYDCCSRNAWEFWYTQHLLDNDIFCYVFGLFCAFFIILMPSRRTHIPFSRSLHTLIPRKAVYLLLFLIF